MRNGGLFEELRRRKVIRVAVVYVIAAIAMINAADLILPALLLPDWSYRLIVVLAILCFPVVVALAWSFDLTPEGLQRTAGVEPQRPAPADELSTAAERPVLAGARFSRPRRAAGRIAVAAVVLGLAGAAMLATRRTGPAVIQHRVAVVPFEDRTGDAQLGALGLTAADWITDGLTAIDTIEVVPTASVQGMLADAQGGEDPVQLLARRTQAGLVVTGTYALAGDSVEVRAQVVDSRRGKVLGSAQPVRAPRSRPMAALAGIRQQILGRVAMRLDVRLGDWTVQSQPPTYEAYQAYVAGTESFLADRYVDAIQEYGRALAADSTFYAAAFRIAVSYGNLGQPAREDSVLRLLEPHRAELSEVNRLVLDWERAQLRGDLSASRRFAVELFHRAPSGTSRYLAALYALRNNRPREAVELLRGEPEGSVMRTRRLDFHIALADALYVLGRHREELNTARHARALFPDRSGAIYLEARALAALGLPGEAEARVADVLSLPTRPNTSAYIVQIGHALAAEGHDEAANRVYTRAVAWWQDHAPPAGASQHLQFAEALRSAGRLQEAADHARAAHAADPLDRYAHALVGLIAAQQGDRALAERIEAELAARTDPYDTGDNTYNRACMRARLGDHDRAVELLRQAHAQGQPIDDWIRIDPDLRTLRGFKPFEDLIRPKG